MVVSGMAAHLYDRVLNIISKDPNDRTDTEVNQILPWFRKKSDLFQPLKDEVVRDIVKNCKFQRSERDTLIIKQGEKGDCFFIILNGTVAIHINTTFGSDEDKKEENEEEKDDGKKEKKDPKKLDRSLYGNYVGKIDAGKSFGELALINADCVRNATIIADETIDLLVVNRDLYNRSIHSIQAKDFEERKQFVQNHVLFSNWQPKYRKQMAMSLRKEKITFDSVIVRQGYPTDGLVFLLSGQAKLQSDPTLHPSQYPRQFPQTDVEDLEKVEARESLRRELSLPAKKLDEQNRSRQNSPVQHLHVQEKSGKKSPHGHRYVEVCLIGAVEIIGDIEATMGLPTYAQTVICTQEAEIYILDQKNYDRLVEKRNPQTVEMIKNFVREKLKLRLSWVQDKELQLFRYFLYKLEEQERSKEKRFMKKEDTKDNPSDWGISSIQKGPVVDMYGPGSVFYAIKMKEKQREMEKLRLHRQGFKKDKPKLVSQNSTVSKSGLPQIRMEEDDNSPIQPQNGAESQHDDVMDSPRTQIVCDDGQGQFVTYEEDTMVDFVDEQSSDQALNQLEQRIQAWHSSFGDSLEGRRPVKRTVKLHRFACEDHRKPLPGIKIVLRSKQKGQKEAIENMKQTLEESHVPSNCPLCEENYLERSDTDLLTGLFLEDQEPKVRRPLSSRINFVPPIILRKRRPKSARQYTAEDYEALKAELRRKQRAFKSLLYRPQTAF